MEDWMTERMEEWKNGAHIYSSDLPAFQSSDQLAQARGNAYHLFSRLYLRGLEPSLLPLVAGIPELAGALDGAAESQVSLIDNLAADHYQLFGLNVFPFESVFLDAEGRMGGPSTQVVTDFYRISGFPNNRHGESPDHIGLELAFLAFLCAAEADAWEDERLLSARRLRRIQYRFLDEHLLRWLPGFLQAVRRQGFPFFSELTELAFELACEHYYDIGTEMVVRGEPFRLHPLPDLLADHKTGFKEISSYLLTPAYSGLYLSRDEITRLAQAVALPRGFGDRGQMLHNLFLAAVDYGCLPDVLDRLSALNAEWVDYYRNISEQGEIPSQIAEVWLERLERTAQIIATIASGSAHL
jgi:TorA maturation chaperone TorD